jgi:hypothetical protein
VTGLDELLDQHHQRYRVWRCEGVTGVMGRHYVTAGTGTLRLFEGNKNDCDLIAARLQGAFYDGAYVAAKGLREALEADIMGILK